MRRAFFGHLFMMLLGLALASLAAAATISLIALLPAKSPDPYRWNMVFSYRPDIPGALLIGAYVNAVYALPGWLISVIIAEIRKERRSFVFAAAGVPTALLALCLADMGIEIISMSTLFLSVLLGGFFGGLVYWAVAGRRSGDWRKRPEPSGLAGSVDEKTLK